MIRGCSELIKVLKIDLSRMTSFSMIKMIRYIVFSPSYKTTFWFRVGSYFMVSRFFKLFYPLVFIIHKRNQYKTGIQLTLGTNIGEGLNFAHFSNIVINKSAIIGKYCTIFNGVTIGSVKGKGAPIIGDNVVIATGAKVVGKVKVGNNVFVGANAVVVKDVPDNCVVGGVPAQILNTNGEEYSKLYTLS